MQGIFSLEPSQMPGFAEARLTDNMVNMDFIRRRRSLIWLVLIVLAFPICCHRRTAGPEPPPVVQSKRTNSAEAMTGRVVRIADGDTVTVLDAMNTQHRIRLQGIDAPESHQAFGTQSKKNLSDLIFDKEVTVVYDKIDQYGRLVGKIIFAGRDINLEQVKAGMAWHYKQFEREQSPEDRELYAQAEDQARSARRGLWVDANPIEPGEFRRDERREREAR